MKKLAQIQNDELRKMQKIREELRIQDIEKLRRARRRQNEIMARIQAAIVQIPKPPTNRNLKAIEAQKMLKKKKEAEEAFREEQLINRLMRQSQQERRIAVQLMYARHEKEVMRQNRILREKQFQERREKEFREALDREAAIQKQENLEREEEIRKIQELHDQIAAERAEARYRKHYHMCQEIMNQILDLVTKTGEYREITNRLIPNKLMREWKEFFFAGYPLYEKASIDPLPSEPTTEQLLELEKQNLLDDNDYEEYKDMAGEWSPPQSSGLKAPAPNNNVLGYVVADCCVLGKLYYSGKSTCLTHLTQGFCVETLLQEALQAYHHGEMEVIRTVLILNKKKPMKNIRY
ncbi:hypothetical protein GDO86_002491 [Hymenochirus boettgeri]|uniref:CPC1/SPEF2 domain-containing protein n=1 Tax=Hymenochirus boettgeri TaxID=247094 RepID=A0A8T2KQU5_9PIPI|nr:hypothetical protein GDO86_002491 [Hymenochirus boettgeri]